jgi:arginyl-tRNA synthetase
LLKNKLEEEIRIALLELQESGLLPLLNDEQMQSLRIKIDRSKDRTADFATGLPLQLAALLRISPLETAELLAGRLQANLLNCAELRIASPGFLNFVMTQKCIVQVLQDIYTSNASEFGKRASGSKAEESAVNDATFMLQYAHIRACSLLELLQQPVLNYVDGEEADPLIGKKCWADSLSAFAHSTQPLEAIFLEADEKLVLAERELLICLDAFSSMLVRCQKRKDPAIVFNYATELALAIQHFCERFQPVKLEREILIARFGLLLASKSILSQTIRAAGLVPAEKF